MIVELLHLNEYNRYIACFNVYIVIIDIILIHFCKYIFYVIFHFLYIVPLAFFISMVVKVFMIDLYKKDIFTDYVKNFLLVHSVKGLRQNPFLCIFLLYSQTEPIIFSDSNRTEKCGIRLMILQSHINKCQRN